MLYMLDTNIASHVIRGDLPAIRQKILIVPIETLVISSVTEAELRYGVAKRGHPKALTHAVQLFLERVETLPWSSDVAMIYADLRAKTIQWIGRLERSCGVSRGVFGQCLSLL